jgi:RNA polymerase sigma factor (sigma-70 family)
LNRRLTRQQQLVAENALQFVEPAVTMYRLRNPSYRKAFRVIDAFSVARYAVADAARTYDPAKSQPTTYFSAAIRNALYREIQKWKRSREGAAERMHLEKLLDNHTDEVLPPIALECLNHLPDEQRDLVERHLLDGQSLLAIGDLIGKDWRTVRGRIARSLEQLHECWQDEGIVEEHRSDTQVP